MNLDNQSEDSSQEERLVRQYGRLKLKEELKAIHQQRLWQNNWLIGFVVTVLLIIMILGYQYQNKRNQSTRPIAAYDQIFDQYYENYPPPQLRSGEEINHRISELWFQYHNENYEIIIPTLDSLSKQSSQFRLYLGLSHLASGHYEEAIEAFEANLGKATHQEETMWFLSLAYVHEQQIRMAIPQLEQLIIRGSSFQANAEELLNRLKE